MSRFPEGAAAGFFSSNELSQQLIKKNRPILVGGLVSVTRWLAITAEFWVQAHTAIDKQRGTVNII